MYICTYLHIYIVCVCVRVRVLAPRRRTKMQRNGFTSRQSADTAIHSPRPVSFPLYLLIYKDSSIVILNIRRIYVL